MSESLTLDQIMQAGKELAVALEKELREYQNGAKLALDDAERMAIEGCPGTIYYDEDGEPYLECEEPEEEDEEEDEEDEWDDEDEEENKSPKELPPRDEETGRFKKE